MPQIWMTYEEVADLLQCGSEQALDRIRDDRLDRKLSHDGHKRVKLNLALTGLFLDKVRAQASAPSAVVAIDALDEAVDDLRSIHGRMADYGSLDDLLFGPVSAEDEAAPAKVAAAG